MQTAVHRLVNLLTEVFEEETWQAPLTASLERLTASQAVWKPERATNSIWMVVNHLSLWKEYHVARLTGEPPRPSGWAEKLDWHEIRDMSERAWQAAMERLRMAQKRLVAELATRTDEDLARPLPGGTSPLYKIQSMVPHDAYHCGQIRLLRALQGVPAKPF
ncbi:MAG TPA: DinB family protein [bacterium]